MPYFPEHEAFFRGVPVRMWRMCSLGGNGGDDLSGKQMCYLSLLTQSHHIIIKLLLLVKFAHFALNALR